MRASRKPRAAAAFLPVLLALSCGGGGGGGGDTGGGGGGTGPDLPDAADYTSSGWTKFEAGDFSGALSDFREALELDSLFGDAHNGAGWSLTRLDSIDSAAGAFDDAIDAGLESADPPAGKAVVLRDGSPADYSGSAAAASDALTIDGRYAFSHDPTFDWRDLHLIVAQCRFALTLYESANARIDSLGGGPADPASDTFVEDLLEEIERLTDLYGG